MKKTYLSNPAPRENLLSGNLVMETGCTVAHGGLLVVTKADWVLLVGIYIYIYICIHTHTYYYTRIHIYIYIYIYVSWYYYYYYALYFRSWCGKKLFWPSSIHTNYDHLYWDHTGHSPPPPLRKHVKVRLKVIWILSSSPLLGFNAVEPSHCGYKHVPSEHNKNHSWR